MTHSEIPSWSAPASESMGLLYRDLQPIEVYVEDSNSEAFYLELTNRMIGDKNSIKKVIPLHGRSHVLRMCDEYQGEHPAIFLIDGDLDLLFGGRVIGKTNLYQLRAYCIENYLFCFEAARELIVEGSGIVLRENALVEDEWQEFLAPIEGELKELFVVFGAARLAKPELKTVSHGLSSILTQRTRAAGPTLDIDKISDLKNRISQECLQKVGEERWVEILAEIRARVSDLEAIDVISGKDFLLPLLSYLIRSKGCGGMTVPSLMFKLAKYCSLTRLDELKHALHEVLAGNSFVSQ